MTLDAVRKLLSRRSTEVGSIYQWCKEHGVRRSHACEFMNGKRLPGSDVLNALGLEWRVVKKPNRT